MTVYRATDADGLLAPLLRAGWAWDVGVANFADEWTDPETVGWIGLLRRGVMLVEVSQYVGRLTLGPVLELPGTEGFDFLDMQTDVDLNADGGSFEAAVERVRDAAARLGLLDLTNISVAPGSEVSTVQAWTEFMSMQILRPAMEARGVSHNAFVRQLSATAFEEFLSFLALSGRVPLPDAVPPAAALGVALCSWRNTAVEDAHVVENELTDVVMAKLTIGATRIAARHISVDRVEWPEIEREFLDSNRTLPDGRTVGMLFGESWGPTTESIQESFAQLRDIEAALTAPVTVRYVSILGATSYTNNWWGNPVWPALCRSMVNARAAAAVQAPAPYDKHGLGALCRDLISTPDHLDDEVLRFCIEGQRIDSGWLPGLRDVPVPPPLTVELPL